MRSQKNKPLIGRQKLRWSCSDEFLLHPDLNLSIRLVSRAVSLHRTPPATASQVSSTDVCSIIFLCTRALVNLKTHPRFSLWCGTKQRKSCLRVSPCRSSSTAFAYTLNTLYGESGVQKSLWASTAMGERTRHSKLPAWKFFLRSQESLWSHLDRS